jgi:hypothetical protein
MTNRNELLMMLQGDEPDEEPVPILVGDLAKLAAEDIPEGVRIEPCSKIAPGTRWPALDDAYLIRGDATPVAALIERSSYRKFWQAPLEAGAYTSLVKEAVEARAKRRRDVVLLGHEDDGAWIHLSYRIDLASDRLDAAFREASRVEAELHEVAEAVAIGIDDSVARARKRLQGWGSEDLDLLVDRMAAGTSHEKGLRLEELATRLFATVPGFSANGRVLTETEEIDVTITNGAMEHPAWSRESALLLAECKNWSTVCGKNEFVLFEDKLRNRAGRVSMGFLISWNGFADTIEKSMLRGSRGDLLMVPLTGQDLREAVRNDSFPLLLEERHQQAILT